MHTRTGERLSLAYALQERRIPAALGALDRFLRDHHPAKFGGGGVALPELHDAALALRSGGVGFYAREQFVHLDTGRVRAW